MQSGWLRASERKLTRAEARCSIRSRRSARRTCRPLPKGKFTELTVPLYYEGHAYRAGSRIRIIISAPNGDQPIWSFANTVPRGRATVLIASLVVRCPRALILPLVPGVRVPTGLPPCPGLRGEPCRTYVATPGVS